MSDTGIISGAGIAPEMVRTQVNRILASDLFRGSPAQQMLIQFLVDESIQCHAKDLKEYRVGTAVFQRGADFDPRTDSIVRVQVGVLRKKLAAYYAAADATDEVEIEIAKGHYVPQFQRRAQIEPDTPAFDPHEPAPGRGSVRPLDQAVLYAAAGVLFGILLVVLLQRLVQRDLEPALLPRPAAVALSASEWLDHPLWKGFFKGEFPTKLVVGVPTFFVIKGLIVRETRVNAPDEVNSGVALRQLQESSHTNGIPVELYTGLGEAAGINLLDRFFAAAGRDLPLVRNRLVRWQDLTSGNVIFIASMRFRTLDRELHLPTDFEFTGPKGEPINLLNHRPRPGEADRYTTVSGHADVETDYALISVWPGTLAGRRIMTIGGSQTWGTEGAAQYATDGASLRELRKKIADAPKGDDAGLQVILKILIRDRQVLSAGYVTHHWLPPR